MNSSIRCQIVKVAHTVARVFIYVRNSNLESFSASFSFSFLYQSATNEKVGDVYFGVWQLLLWRCLYQNCKDGNVTAFESSPNSDIHVRVKRALYASTHCSLLDVNVNVGSHFHLSQCPKLVVYDAIPHPSNDDIANWAASPDERQETAVIQQCCILPCQMSR